MPDPARPDSPAQPAPPARPDSPARPWLRMLRWVILYTLVEIAGTALAVSLVRLLDPGLFDAGEPGRIVSGHLLLFTLFTAGTALAATLATWQWLDREAPADLFAFAAPPPRPLPAFGLGLLAALLLLVPVTLPALRAAGAGLRPETGGPAALAVRLGAAIPALLLVAANEETAFRGYLLKRLLQVARPWVAIVLSSIAFAAFHVMNPGLTPLAWLNLHLAGALLALLALAGGGLWLPIGFHFAWNFALGIGASLPVSGLELPGVMVVPPGGPEWFTGGAFGPEGSVVTSVVLGLAVLGVARRARVDWNRCPSPPTWSAEGPGGVAPPDDPRPPA